MLEETDKKIYKNVADSNFASPDQNPQHHIM
jgi:hypothetical protein